MKKILLSSVALLGLTAGAFAADLPSRRAPAPYVAVPVFTWTGFYVGVNAGYGFSDNNDNGLGTFQSFGAGEIAGLPRYVGTVTTPNSSNGRDGFVGGGQIGYNYQIGNFVIGVEADIQYADLGGGRRSGNIIALNPTLPDFIPAVNSTFGGLDYFGTVRGRVGYAWDRLLVYGTGGFAYGGSDNNGNNTCVLVTGALASGCTGRNSDDIRTGYAAGGGIEYAFTPNITGRIEGLYVSLDQSRQSGFIGAHAAGLTPIYITNSRDNNYNSFAVVRAGLNYKFNTF